MAKTPRTTEAFHFQDFPVDDLEIRPPNHVVESLFGIPGLKGLREPFINLSPNKGEWLRTCFDIEVDHISTLKDGNGVPRAFKLVVDVEGDQEIFMNKLNKQFHRVFLESLQERGGPIPKVEWHPILMEKRGYASSFSVKVNLRETVLKIYNSNADEKLRTGKGWDFIKDVRFANAKAKLAFAPVRIWHKEGKAGVALQASLLVVDESDQRPALSDCFGEDDL